MMKKKNPPLKIFLSYSHKDREFLIALKEHLAELEHQGRIAIWYDDYIWAGERWSEEIERQLERADLVLLLISASSLASKYCRKESERAFARQQEGQAIVVPILLRAANWQWSPQLAGHQMLPREAKPIEEHSSRHSAFTEVARELGSLVEDHLAPSVTPHKDKEILEPSPSLGATVVSEKEVAAPVRPLLAQFKVRCEPLQRLYTRAALREAKVLWEAALSLAEEMTPRHPEMGSILYQLGLIQRDLGDLSAARQVLQRSLDLALGDQEPDLGQVAGRQSDLAEVHRRLGDLGRAWELVGKEYPACGPRETLHQRNVQALILKDQGDLGAAQSQLSAALEVGVLAGLAETPELAATRLNLALLYKDSGDYDEAESQLSLALAIDEEHYGPEHPEVAFDCNGLGLVLQARRNYLAARAQFQRALQIISQALGEDHPYTASIRRNLEGLSLRGLTSAFLGYSAAA
jgi:tetratricopeptide (TPR) repeat protein